MQNKDITYIKPIGRYITTDYYSWQDTKEVGK